MNFAAFLENLRTFEYWILKQENSRTFMVFENPYGPSMLESSMNAELCVVSKKCGKSFMYSRNRSRPRFDPCGTLHLIFRASDNV